MRKDAPLVVDVPSSNRDSPAWVKVGVIAAVGFVIGIAWPKVVGVRLGPSAPGDTASASASASHAPAARASQEAPPASVAAKPSASVVSPAASSAAPAPAGPPLV